MRASSFKVDPKWSQRFAMITRGFVEEFSQRMSRNAWVSYLGLATFYNRHQQRAFPNLEQLSPCYLSADSHVAVRSANWSAWDLSKCGGRGAGANGGRFIASPMRT